MWEAASFAGVEYHNKKEGRENTSKIYTQVLES